MHLAPSVQAGNLMAGWLHRYMGMPLQEAILSMELGTEYAEQQVGWGKGGGGARVVQGWLWEGGGGGTHPAAVLRTPAGGTQGGKWG